MVDFIEFKDNDGKGQLDRPTCPEVIMLFMLAGKELYKIDPNSLTLICNQLNNVISVIELASFDLIYSSGNISEAMCQKWYSWDNVHLKERVSVKYLLNSIIYYNASFDYFKVLLRYIYSSYDELIMTYPRNKVENEMQKLCLKRNWDLALNSLITKPTKKYEKWLEKNDTIPNTVRKAFIELEKRNDDLKNKYQANQLKHGAVPCFGTAGLPDITRAQTNESLEQFYNRKEQTSIRYDIGLYENKLQINEVQGFLVDYHNSTIQVLNEVLKDTGFDRINETQNGKRETTI